MHTTDGLEMAMGGLRAILAVTTVVMSNAVEPLMITPLVKSGRFEEARALSQVTIDNISMGHSGFFSVPSATGRNTNHLFAWYQPCIEGCSDDTPLIHYFNGGPGSPSIANGGMAQALYNSDDRFAFALTSVRCLIHPVIDTCRWVRGSCTTHL